MNRNQGFTLLELMVVVAIIAILAAIAIPSYIGIQKRAARSEAKANLEAISLVLEGYMAENNDYGSVQRYVYICGDNCTKSSFVPAFPVPLGTIANLGGGYSYDYAVNVTSQLNPAYIISALPVRGRAVGDLTPFVQSDGTKGPANFGW